MSLQGFSINIPTCRAINQNEREQSRPAEEREKENTLQVVLQEAVINYYQLKAVTDSAILHLSGPQEGLERNKVVSCS